MNKFNFNQWILVFEENAKKEDAFCWTNNEQLTSAEKATIYESIQQFQKGESGEGKYLFQDAKKYTERHKDISYMTALTLFIHEEHRHSKYLLKFMQLHGIEKEQGHWVDNIFRWIRHKGNLEVTITVLLCAELIAVVYYKALANATKSILLKQLCERILQDEDLHIRFQSFAINRIQKSRNPLLNHYMRLHFGILLAGTIPVVWYFHKKVFKQAGYSFLKFALETFNVFRKSLKMIQSKDKELLQMEQVW